MWILFLTFPLSIVWFTSCLAETNRIPFDFAEGESELVTIYQHFLISLPELKQQISDCSHSINHAV